MSCRRPLWTAPCVKKKKTHIKKEISCFFTFYFKTIMDKFEITMSKWSSRKNANVYGTLRNGIVYTTVKISGPIDSIVYTVYTIGTLLGSQFVWPKDKPFLLIHSRHARNLYNPKIKRIFEIVWTLFEIILFIHF